MLLSTLLAIGAVGSLVSMAVVIVRREARAPSTYVFAAAVCALLWSLAGLVAPVPAPLSASLARLALCTEVAGVAALLIAIASMVGGPRGRWVAHGTAMVGLVWCVLAWLPNVLVVFGAPAQRHVLCGQPTALLFLAWAGAAGACAIALPAYGIARRRGRTREQARYLLLAGLVLAAGVLAPHGADAFGGFIVIGAWAPLAFAVALGLVTIALVSRRLVSPLRSLRPWLVSGIAAALASWLYTVTSQLRYDLFCRTVGLGHLAAVLAGAASLIGAFLALRWLVGWAVDSLLLRQSYDVREVIRDTGDALTDVAQAEAILHISAQAIQRTFRPVSGMLLTDGPEGHLVPAVCWGQDRLAVPDLPYDHPCVADLCASPDPIMATQRGSRRAAPPAARHLRAWGLELGVAIQAAGHRHAVALLGEKASGDAYTAEDVLLLRALATQTAIALENARHCAALEALNAVLEARVAERTAELRDANARLREDDKAKDEFLAFTSHELITPLTSIIGWGEVGLYSVVCSDDMRRVLDNILRGAWRQRRLVGELLDASRLIHGKLILKPESGDLWALACQAVEEMMHGASERGLTLHTHAPDEPLPVEADTQRLLQVLTNLLGNAYKFTPAGGEIHVTGFRAGSMVGIAVRDTGRGIPADALGSIFGMFKQVLRFETGGGLGLGLSLAKSILEMHGGHITVDSPGSNMGSTFTIELPIARCAVGVPSGAGGAAPDEMDIDSLLGRA